MRPIRLELEGFTAYREFTVLDFEGADLFVVTGPTGSGKSSLIDAITFALYGSVPRYQNPNLVHPVISQGKIEARVRFDFGIGNRTYRAVRVVRKTPRGGATTKEACLESDGRVLAGTGDEISRKVRELIGLNFEQFTTSVVLPQGQFARFLLERPAERQDLLTKLLGVDLYERMGNLARTRESVSRHQADLHTEELARFREATPAARKVAGDRVRHLKKLKDAIEEAEPELERLGKEAEALSTDQRRLEDEAKLLECASVPAGLAALAKKLATARSEIERAGKEHARAEEALTSIEKAHAKLPDPAELRKTLAAHEEQHAKTAALEDRRRALSGARRELTEKESAEEASRQNLERARRELDEARRRLAAHDLAAHLQKGKPCPVCQRIVDAVPTPSLPPALSDAESAVRKAEAEHQKAARELRDAAKSAALAERGVQAVEREVALLTSHLEKALSQEELEAELNRAEASTLELEEAKKTARTTRSGERRAKDALEQLSEEETRAWRAFEETRDALAALGPPRSDRENLAEAWAKLTEWARSAAPLKWKDAEKAANGASRALESREHILEDFSKKAFELDVACEPERPRDAVVTALAEAEQDSKRIEDALERASTLRTLAKSEHEAAQVAGALGQHLKATGFERWLLEEAFRRLVSGATEILKELSGGQYSFEYDDKLNFEIVDHANADERRSAKTLSGGETFLASLALALTLAEQTADLAAEGSARLESLFLDEGFGTLDDENLEIVAAAIEELGAKGRVVGVVTHQQTLADKIAVQFRVSKGPATATVEKIVS